MHRDQSPNKKWLVFYTKSRWEKRINTYLDQQGFESFLPLVKVVRQWSDRKKKMEIPLFNSYIFVRVAESRIREILQIPGISWIISHEDKPAVLRDDEIDLVKRFITSGLLVETVPAQPLQAGDLVEVVDGPLKGVKGVLTSPLDEGTITVNLESIDRAIRISLDRRLLRKP